MSFTEKPVFVLVNDMFLLAEAGGQKRAGKSCRGSFSVESTALRREEEVGEVEEDWGEREKKPKQKMKTKRKEGRVDV